MPIGLFYYTHGRGLDWSALEMLVCSLISEVWIVPFAALTVCQNPARHTMVHQVEDVFH
jgi:hypothetical protein